MNTIKEYTNYLKNFYGQRAEITKDYEDDGCVGISVVIDKTQSIYLSAFEDKIIDAVIECDWIRYNRTKVGNGFYLSEENGDLKYFQEIIETIIPNKDIFMIELMQDYINSVEYLIGNFKPILNKFGFIPYYSSILDSSEKENSNLVLEYKYKYARDNDYEGILVFIVDILTRKMSSKDLEIDDIYSITEEEFEKRIINFMFNNGKIPLMFEYYFQDDPSYTAESYPEIIKLLYAKKKNNIEHINVDFSKIPEKYKNNI